MQGWVDRHGFTDNNAMLNAAFALSEHYGSAIGALACQMYEATAAAQGVTVNPAEAAATPEYGEVAKAVNGAKKRSEKLVPSTVGRLVKQVGADTTLKNAQRDGAQFAWVPHGDSCAFCLMLASRGWQYMSKKALKNGHAEHIHANCDCQYAVRFDGKSTVEGYDPDEYKEMYDSAEGNTTQEKLNSMRRAMAAEKREKSSLQAAGADGIITSGARITDPESSEAQAHAQRYYGLVRSMTTDVEKIAKNTGYTAKEIQQIKDFVFYEKHDLGGLEPEQFAPDFAMSQSWQRLIEGTPEQHDLTLLQHESMERQLMETGMSQYDAHIETSKTYDYSKEVKEFYAALEKRKNRK